MTILPFPNSELHNARATDPATTWKAARINQKYRSQLRFSMLEFHGIALRDDSFRYIHHGFTDHEIVVAMGLPVVSLITGKVLCNWKRHGELYTDFGFCDVLPGSLDASNRSLIINERGLEHLDEVLRRYPKNEYLYERKSGH